MSTCRDARCATRFAPAPSRDQDAVTAAAQVLDALAHAHRAGIVHRDVKPANILLEDRDEIAVRLLDFGLAQFDGADTLTAVGDVPGTLAYIAPERLDGGDATAQSDVWSVGVLLWETLTDRHPFWGMPIQEVARAIQAGAPPLATERRGLPRRLVTAVDAALVDRSEPSPERVRPRRRAPERVTRPRAPHAAQDARQEEPVGDGRSRPQARAPRPAGRSRRRDRGARRDVPAVLAARARRAARARNRASPAGSIHASAWRSRSPSRSFRSATSRSPLAGALRDLRRRLAGCELARRTPRPVVHGRPAPRSRRTAAARPARADSGAGTRLGAQRTACSPCSRPSCSSAVAGEQLPGRRRRRVHARPRAARLRRLRRVRRVGLVAPRAARPRRRDPRRRRVRAPAVGAGAARGSASAAVGLVVTAASVLAGAGIASTIVVMLAWAGFALAAAAPRRAA